MEDYLPRLVAPRLRQALERFPAVVLTGARQTGKSTLATRLDGDSRTYVTLDGTRTLSLAETDPEGVIAIADRLVIDEVQRAPKLLLEVKRAIDANRSPGRFVLTGSANLLLMRGVSETLAGRAAYFELHPLTRREQLGMGTAGRWSELFASKDDAWHGLLGEAEALRDDWRLLARRGGYPEPARLASDDAREDWFEGFVETYLVRDVRGLADVASLRDFRRLMRAVCLRVGGVANYASIARDVNMPAATLHRHIGLMETSYQLAPVPAFSMNRTKRLIKSPKLYWSDSGLAMHIAGERSPRGEHLENLVAIDLRAWATAERRRPEILHWRTTTGSEVDFVIEWDGSLLPLEVKATKRPTWDDSRGLRAFRAEYPESRAGLLLHSGDEIRWFGTDVLAAPWWRVL